MNKKILLIGCVVAALGTSFGIAQRETDTPMKSLMMENVEALANDETSDGYNIVDRVESSYIDPATNEKRTIITYVCEGDGPLACG